MRHALQGTFAVLDNIERMKMSVLPNFILPLHHRIVLKGGVVEPRVWERCADARNVLSVGSSAPGEAQRPVAREFQTEIIEPNRSCPCHGSLSHAG